MAHQCKSILFHCMDFRLLKEINRWLEEQNLLGDCDLVSVAGAGRGLLEEQSREVLLSQIEASSKLHSSQEIILLHHSGCGAYALNNNFSSAQEEKDCQVQDIEKEEVLLREKFPNMKIRKIWAELKDHEGKEIDFIEL